MGTNSRARRARWLMLTTAALSFGLSSASVNAESGESSIIRYANLPSGRQLDDPQTTGSLPNASGQILQGSSGFSSSLSKGRIILRTSAPTGCLPGSLRQVIADVAARFGPLSIESTHRGRKRNFRAGGARHSLHLSCRAIDFRMRGRSRGVMAYLRSRPEVGGLKVYRNGIIHIDNGTRRTW